MADDTARPIDLELQHKVKAILEDETRLRLFPIKEQLAVALILDRVDFLEDLDHTVLEAVAHIGPEMLAACFRVEQWYRDPS